MDVVITLYGMAAVLIYMMLIGDFMSDIAPWCIPVENPWGTALGGGVIPVFRSIVRVQALTGRCSGVSLDAKVIRTRDHELVNVPDCITSL